jgi:predicted phosphodiesterase
MRANWTPENLRVARGIVGRSRTLDEAASEVSSAMGYAVTKDSLKCAFVRHGMESPYTYLGLEPPSSERGVGRPPAAVAPADGTLLSKLVALTKKGPLEFETACDKLDLSPAKCRGLIENAKAAGYAFEFVHGKIEFRLPDASAEVRSIGVAPVVGERQQIAVISDTHLGSKYCLREQLVEFIHYAYNRGVRECFHPGDVLDGCYRHGQYELTHVGIEEQTRDLFETLPQLPGLNYRMIGGNHDDTFSDAIGIDAGTYVQQWFEAHGRQDVKFYGRRGAYLRYGGATVELWHPKKGPSYALSYGLQNHVRDYAVGAKPDFLLVGHWHVWCFIEQRGVYALAAGTFQGSGSAYGKSLGGAPSMGGTIISWDLTADGTLRHVQVERSAYYEHEKPRHI